MYNKHFLIRQNDLYTNILKEVFYMLLVITFRYIHKKNSFSSMKTTLLKNLT